MQNFYIKSDASYCVLEENEQEVGLVAIMDYLIQTGKLQDEKVASALNSIRGFINKQNNSYHFKFITFRKAPMKNASQKTDAYSLTDVANNFHNLGILHTAMKVLEASYKKNEDLMQSVTTTEFKQYFDYSGTCDHKAHSYVWTKMRNASYGYSASDRQAYEDRQKGYINEYKTQFPSYEFSHVIDLKDFVKNPYKNMYAAWKKVLNDDGTPKVIEEDGFIQRFNEKEGYALFLADRRNGGNFGFWGSTNSSLTDINQAKLFQNLKQAHRYASSMRSGVALVKVNVKFSEVAETIGNIDTSALEAAKSAQEKAYLDSLMNDDNEVKSLAKKLLSACGEGVKYEELKEHLNKLIDEKEEVIIAKKKNKI